MRVFLMGMPGSGKTTVGKKLAKKLSLDFFDLDQLIEQKVDLTISEIFAEKGELAFREMEKQCLEECISNKNNFLLSLGGGTPCAPDNLICIKSSGISVYLESQPELLVQRIMQGNLQRPLFNGLSEKEISKRIQELLLLRTPYYVQADIHVNAFNLDVHSLSKQIQQFSK